MTFAQLINAVEAALKPLAAQSGGDVEIAETPQQAHAFLKAAPNRWRIILHWEGYGDHEHAREGMTTHQVATLLQAPRGLVHRPGENLTTPKPGGQPPFSERMELVSEWMRAMRFPNGTGADFAGFALGSSQWVETTGNFAAHVFNWQLAAALPGFAQHIVLDFPNLSPTPTP